ncbi:cyclin-G-associated kinase [Trichogramma pretiosum]|uniref:cyclin-G-associated kinase n=1 Tax=Trichogramma pretiosum TaxID=7493 RepID=UPI0006C9C106|nr:cyclin-G-associated kinase [Trichogramma pretiosum]
MSDYLRSAFGYLNGGPAGSNGGDASSTTAYTATATSSAGSELVGQNLDVNGVKLRVTRLIAEGGWALVFAVVDVSTGKEYALKRMIAVDEEAKKTIHQEIETLKALTNHPNIIQFLCVQQVNKSGSRGDEYLLVTELCPGGTVADILRNVSVNSLSVAQICRIAYQATKAVHHMHSQPQPFIHRDIKLENFLIGQDGLVKLCDFGSTTLQQILPDTSWNAQKHAQLEDHLAKYTTPMYRAPEMMDTWSNEPIGPPVDCWALGCVIYTLVTLRHPFPEGNKLAIVNGKYTPIPNNPTLACFNDLIKGCLETSPMQRLTTSAILERLAAIAESNGFDPREAANIEPIKPAQPVIPPRPGPHNAAAVPPPRPAPPGSNNSMQPPPRPGPPRPGPPGQYGQPQQSSGSGLFSSIKGGAGSIFRNLKDTSSKVMQTVQQSINRTELDASYITSRILVMPYPADGIESAYRANHVEDVRAFLQARHPPPTKIQFYNLSKGRPNVARLIGKHIDCSFAFTSGEANAPLLSAIYQICQDIHRFLDVDVHHTVVLYCNDGLRASAVVACSLLLYSGVVHTVDEALNLFATRRCQPPQIQPSEIKMIEYMAQLANHKLPHMKPLILRSLLVQPVPLFTRARDGCRPYVEIYSNGAMVFSTKRNEYEEMKLFGMNEGKVCLILGDAAVRGDISMVLYHARQQLGRVIGIKMASFHFHTGYVPLKDSTLIFEKKDLDDTPEIGGHFRIVVNAMIGEDSAKFARVPAPWEAEDATTEHIIPDPLFGSTLEMEETLENFRIEGSINHLRQSKEPTPEAAPLVRPSSSPTPPPRPPQLPRKPSLVADFPPPQVEADLLNLGGGPSSDATPAPAPTPTYIKPEFDIFAQDATPSAAPLIDNKPAAAVNDDLLGGFGSFVQAPPPPNTPTANQAKSAADLMFGQTNGDLLFGQSKNNFGSTNTSQSKDIFDPFAGSSKLGNWGEPKAAANTLNTENVFPRNTSVPNFKNPPPKPDPFADLAGTMGAGLASSWNGTTNTPQSQSPATGGTPIHATTPRMQQAHTPMYEMPQTNVSSEKPPKSGDAFEDLLGSQGYNFFTSKKAENNGPKTMNEMRKVEAAKTMDPETLKVAEWTEGKKGNLRALLCSMHSICWDGCKWQKCEMHMLVSPADVKKAYRKACLAVHPDKQVGTENENLAKLMFMELNNAWSTFENDASQQKLFS